MFLMNEARCLYLWINIRTLSFSRSVYNFIFFTSVSGATLYRIVHSCMEVMEVCMFLRIMKNSLLCHNKSFRQKISLCKVKSSSYRLCMVSSSVGTSPNIVVPFISSRQTCAEAVFLVIVQSYSTTCLTFCKLYAIFLLSSIKY